VISRSVVLAVVLAFVGIVPAVHASAPGCQPRILVLSAMPLELDPMFNAAQHDWAHDSRIEDRTFYAATIAGRSVALAMTGIGMVNAAQTAELALSHAKCAIRAVVFSGVAGSTADIGDVMVPDRWTSDGGHTWLAADGALLAAARRAAADAHLGLRSSLPAGDPGCACPGVDAPTPVDLHRTPAVHVGGRGSTADTFGTHAVPCAPGGGDIAGCEPCVPGAAPQDLQAFASRVPRLIDPAFIAGELASPDSSSAYEAQDEETAVVAAVARRHHVPFLGVRAVSDGAGDPLHLPGFPAQFFVYRQLAGDNAAAYTVALLRNWPA